MAKGAMRPNKETRKPKKDAKAKPAKTSTPLVEPLRAGKPKKEK